MNIIKFEKTYSSKPYLSISLLGKSYKLNIKYTSTDNIKLNKKDSEFVLVLPKKYKNLDNLDIIYQAIEKLYSETAPKEIEDSLELARHILKFAPEDYKIQRMDNCGFKILKKKILVINPDIIAYSKEIINTSIIKELCKMAYGYKTKAYMQNIKIALNKYEEYKKDVLNNDCLIYRLG